MREEPSRLLGPAVPASAASALWTFPAVIFSAVLISWAAEAAQFLMSQGMALAILAWLQTLPEFAVEAVIAWEAGKQPEMTHLMIANLTGSLRLLVGLGWPMIYATAAFMWRRRHGKPLREIELEKEHAVEVVGLGVPILYFFLIYWKGTLACYDGVILTLIYLAYLAILNRIPPQDEAKIEDMERVPRWILQRSRPVTISIIWLLFIGGGVILYFTAHPFLESMLTLATGWGISTFVFVQWVAPFLSEFPEKLSAFYWARKISGAPMALMNMVSSNINQWTMLAAMLPFVLSFSRGEMSMIILDHHQRLELLLTMSQSLFGLLLLANMRFSWYEALGIFVLWLGQFVFSGFPPNFADGVKIVVTIIYFTWSGWRILMAVLGREQLVAFPVFAELMRKHWARGGQPA